MTPESTFDWVLFILLGLSSIASLVQTHRFNALRDRVSELESLHGERLPDYEPVTIAIAETCAWSLELFNDWWITECGKRHRTIIGTDKAVAFTYCPSCGRKIVKADSK